MHVDRPTSPSNTKRGKGCSARQRSILPAAEPASGSTINQGNVAAKAGTATSAGYGMPRGAGQQVGVDT